MFFDVKSVLITVRLDKTIYFFFEKAAPWKKFQQAFPNYYIFASNNHISIPKAISLYDVIKKLNN